MGFAAWHDATIMQADDEKVVRIFKDGRQIKEATVSKKNLSYFELEKILKAYAMEWEK